MRYGKISQSPFTQSKEDMPATHQEHFASAIRYRMVIFAFIKSLDEKQVEKTSNSTSGTLAKSLGVIT